MSPGNITWREFDSMVETMATIDQPDASINGSKPKKVDWHAQLKVYFDRLLISLTPDHPELKDRHNMEVWKTMFGLGVLEQGQKGLVAFFKLKRALCIVEYQQINGNPIDEGKMCGAAGLFNEAKNVSHFYDILQTR